MFNLTLILIILTLLIPYLGDCGRHERGETKATGWCCHRSYHISRYSELQYRYREMKKPSLISSGSYLTPDSTLGGVCKTWNTNSSTSVTSGVNRMNLKEVWVWSKQLLLDKLPTVNPVKASCCSTTEELWFLQFKGCLWGWGSVQSLRVL